MAAGEVGEENGTVYQVIDPDTNETQTILVPAGYELVQDQTTGALHMAPIGKKRKEVANNERMLYILMDFRTNWGRYGGGSN